jgi:hypothetical protein
MVTTKYNIHEHSFKIPMTYACTVYYILGKLGSSPCLYLLSWTRHSLDDGGLDAFWSEGPTLDSPHAAVS